MLSVASIISLILWFALLGSGAWMLAYNTETDPTDDVCGDWPYLNPEMIGSPARGMHGAADRHAVTTSESKHRGCSI